MNNIDDRIASKKAELDKLRPLSRKSLDALSSWYDVEITYTSNAIEGNTLTRSETAILLEKGITVNGKPFKDHAEAIGHKEALSYMRSLAAAPQGSGPLVREGDIRELHRLVIGRADPEEAGRYSQHARAIAGSMVRLPSPAEIGPLMGDFARSLESAQPTPQTAFDAHLRLVSIHPFSDGNGRTARLLMNLVLLKGGYPPVVIAPEHRADYIESLETHHTARDSLPFMQFMTDRLENSFDRHLDTLLMRRAWERSGSVPRPQTP